VKVDPESLKKAFADMTKNAPPPPVGPCTVDVDENNVVWVTNAKGAPVMFMPLADYLSLMEKDAGPCGRGGS
jgi:hypothetical protein